MDLQVKEDKGGQSESGFYCEVCDCIVKDSLNYLDHVNGKRHNRNLGISLKNFTDSTLEEVKEMLEFKKREREDKAFGYNADNRNKDDEQRWKLRREKKKRQKARRTGGYFNDEEKEGSNTDDDGDDDEQQGPELDDDEGSMAKLMGFSSFSTSKK